MAFVIAEPCVGCKDTACVDVCPPIADSIHPRRDEPEFDAAESLSINPATCIDCGACTYACPVEAIFALNVQSRPQHDQKIPILPERWSAYGAKNRDYFATVSGSRGAEVSEPTVNAREHQPPQTEASERSLAVLLELIAVQGGGAPLSELVAAVGHAEAAAMVDREIGATLSLAQFTGNLAVLARLRPLVNALEALGDARASMYAEVCIRRRFPGW